MNRRITASAMLALMMALAVPALAACSAGDAGSSTAEAGSGAGGPQMGPPDTGDSAGKVAGAAAADSAGSLPGDPGANGSAPRAVVTTISTTVIVPDVPGATARVIAATTASKGYVQAQYTTASGENAAVSTLTVRIPGALIDQFLANVTDLGTVSSTERSSDDVTATVADIDARLANAKAGVVRLRALMAKATKISDIVAIESALSERQAQAESLAAQQRALADQTSLATITVVLTPEVESAPTGFLGGLSAGWDAFKASVTAIARMAGYLLPFAILAAVLGGLLLIIVRAATHRSKAPAAPGSPATGTVTQAATPTVAPAASDPATTT
jgi:hypothetical protein